MVIASLFVTSGLLRGWLSIAGCGTIAALYLSGAMEYGPRRQAVAFGTYMAVFPLQQGLDRLWHGEPSWLTTTFTALLVLAVAWFAFEVHSAKRVASPTIRV
jgi:hypothetical protein